MFGLGDIRNFLSHVSRFTLVWHVLISENFASWVKLPSCTDSNGLPVARITWTWAEHGGTSCDLVIVSLLHTATVSGELYGIVSYCFIMSNCSIVSLLRGYPNHKARWCRFTAIPATHGLRGYQMSKDVKSRLVVRVNRTTPKWCRWNFRMSCFCLFLSHVALQWGSTAALWLFCKVEGNKCWDTGEHGLLVEWLQHIMRTSHDLGILGLRRPLKDFLENCAWICATHARVVSKRILVMQTAMDESDIPPRLTSLFIAKHPPAVWPPVSVVSRYDC